MRREFGVLQSVGQHQRFVGHDRARADRIVARRGVEIDADPCEKPLMFGFDHGHDSRRASQKNAGAVGDALKDGIAVSRWPDDLPHLLQARVLVGGERKSYRWLFHSTCSFPPGPLAFDKLAVKTALV